MIARGYPNPPRLPPLAPAPLSAIVKPLPRLSVANPGDPFTATVQPGFNFAYNIPAGSSTPDFFRRVLCERSL